MKNVLRSIVASVLCFALILGQSADVFAMSDKKILMDEEILFESPEVETVIAEDNKNILENKISENTDVLSKDSENEEYVVPERNDNSVIVTEGLNDSFDVKGSDGGFVETSINSSEEDCILSVGRFHVAVRKNDGNLWTWGENYHGSLGDGTTTDSYTPVKVSGLENVKSISLGYYHSAAIKEDGSLWMWGHNNTGELGDGSTEDSLLPKKVEAINKRVKFVSLGDFHSAAIDEDGCLWMWGWNGNGQLGEEGTGWVRETPKINTNIRDVKYVSMGSCNSAAIDKDGYLWLWGCNNNYQIGNGYNVDQLTPQKLDELENVKQVSLGGLFSSAVTENGDLWMWGEVPLKDGTSEIYKRPKKIQSNIKTVFAGFNHCAVIDKDGVFHVWGNGIGEISIDNVMTASLGQYFTAIITNDGDLYTWGYTACGQFGNGTKEGNTQYSPDTPPIMNIGPGKNTYTVVFDKNGGTGELSCNAFQDCKSGGKIPVPSGNNLFRRGYKFLGWSLESKVGGKLYKADGDPYIVNPNDAIDGVITLYASWFIDTENTFQSWGFTNNSDYFGLDANGYAIQGSAKNPNDKSDYNRLFSSVDSNIKALMEEDIDNKYKLNPNLERNPNEVVEWNGSCYGMSVIAMMINNGDKTISDFFGDKYNTLNEIIKADENYSKEGTVLGNDSVGEVESIINFYQSQTDLVFSVDTTEFLNTFKEESKRILEVANRVKEAVNNGNKCVIIRFNWTETDIETLETILCGHAILGIGYRDLTPEEQYYNIYPHCIITYDPNSDTPGYSDCNIYYNDEGKYIIPAYKHVLRNFAAFDNIERLAPIDYKTGNCSIEMKYDPQIIGKGDCCITSDRGSVSIADLEIKSNTSNYNYIILPESDNGEASNSYKVNVPESSYYKIEADKICHQIATTDLLIRANSSNGGIATLNMSGDANISSDKSGEMSLRVVSNEVSRSIPSQILIEADDVKELSEKKQSGGIVVDADDFSTLKITTDNDSMICHPEGNSVLVKEVGDDIEVYEDSDNDGNYDKKIDGMTDWTDTTGLPTVPGSYILQNDVRLNECWNVNTDISLDLNGHTIDRGLTQPIENGSVISILNGATLTITDSNPDKEGFITGGNNKIDVGGGVFINDGRLIMTGGIITGNKGGGVHVNDNASFDMSGGEISGNSADFGAGVHVWGNFRMSGDAKVTGNTASEERSNIVCIESKGIFTMDGGMISDNEGTGVHNTGVFNLNDGMIINNKGRGVEIMDGKVTMAGGSIKGNVTNLSGGGVFICGGTFDMSGNSCITGNSAKYGGGVLIVDYRLDEVVSEGIFTMTGNASITGNKATEGCGGVYIDDGTFIMNGGKITGNSSTSNMSGGVFCSKSSTFTVSGSPVVRLNYKGGTRTPEGVYTGGIPADVGVHDKELAISVTGPLKDNAEIYVNGKVNKSFAQGAGGYELTESDVARFKTDYRYKVVLKDRKAYIEKNTELALAGQKINLRNIFDEKLEISRFVVDNKALAAVTKDMLTCKKPGTVKVTAQKQLGKNQYEDVGECSVKILNKPQLKFTKPMSYIGQTMNATEYFVDEDIKIYGATSWESSKPGIVEVTNPATGAIKAKGSGTASITAYFGEKGKAGTLKVSASINVKIPAFQKNEYKMLTGAKLTLSMKNVTGASDPEWKAAKDGIIRVTAQTDKKGNKTGKVIVEGLACGDTKLIATIDGQKYECTVYVAKPTISKSEMSLKTGQSGTLTLKNTSLKKQDIVWKSANESIAKVDAGGKITALAAGNTVIYTETGGARNECAVTVAKPVINKTEMEIKADGTGQLSLKNTNLKKQDITWKSSNERIATVDAGGKVKGISAGRTTVYTDAGGVRNECVVTVK